MAEAETAADAAAGAGQAAPGEIRVEPVDVHPPTRLERTSYGALRALAAGLARLLFRLDVRGREHLPTQGPFVLAPVHRSNIDFLLAALVRRPRMRYMGKASIWKYPRLGRFFAMLGAFPVHRGTADREALRTCVAVIENGESLVMFPEGSRRSGPVVEDLFDGPAYVAARTGVPVVPLGIGGSDKVMPLGSKLIRPHKVVLIVGEPVRPPVGDGTGRVRRRAVRTMTEQLEARLQALYTEAQRAAG